LSEVRDRRHKWTWTYFAQRRNDRHQYVDLFRAKLSDSATQSVCFTSSVHTELTLLTRYLQELDTLRSLEKSLSYQDITFYRSIARSHARKDMVTRQRLEEEKKKQQQQASSSWTGWLWGSSEKEKPSNDPVFTGEMTDEQRQQLYEALDYDERAALIESFQAPRDAVKLKLSSKLDKGLFALRTDPHETGSEILSLTFDVFVAEFVQRPDSFDASISLGGFAVYDGTTKDSLYPQIVHVKESQRNGDTTESLGKDEVNPDDPFFYVKFESNPLDERADNALTVRMRHMEVIYHKGYVEAVYNFFKPPDNQLESVEALLVSLILTLFRPR
jgi:vacuolar protein sorting-associated protein 13A/C